MPRPARPLPPVRFRTPVAAIVLAGLVLLAFSPVLWAGFINWDDGMYVAANSWVLRGPSLQGLKTCWGSYQAGYYIPITWMGLMLNAQLWGGDPFGYHLANLILHAINSVLLLMFLRQAMGDPWRSFLAAALFAIHPLRVESVAWVSEFKDVLGLCLALSTLLCYLFYLRKPSIRRYFIVAAVFSLSLLAKPIGVTLPCVLLLLDFWPLRRWGWQASEKSDGSFCHQPAALPNTLIWLAAEKLPLLVMSIVSSVLTFEAARRMGDVRTAAPGSRVANMIVSYVRYLGDMLWPTRLAAFYPLRAVQSPVQVAVCLILLLTMTAWAIAQRHARPHLIVGWLWFLGSLVPMIGLVQAFEQARADRFTYFPMIGVLLMAVWSLPRWQGSSTTHRVAMGAVAGAIVLLLAGVTFAQSGYWRDDLQLWQRTLAVTHDNAFAEYSLSQALSARYHSTADPAALHEAIAHLKRSAVLNPDQAAVHGDLAVLLGEAGRVDDAIAELKVSLSLSPRVAQMHNNLGTLLLQKEDRAGAIAEFTKAADLDPGYAAPRINLGYFFAKQNDWSRARHYFEAAEKAEGANPQNLLQLGQVYMALNDPADAQSYLLRAIHMSPTLVDARQLLGISYMKLGRPDLASEQFQAALSVAPRFQPARQGLAAAQAAQQSPRGSTPR